MERLGKPWTKMPFKFQLVRRELMSLEDNKPLGYNYYVIEYTSEGKVVEEKIIHSSIFDEEKPFDLEHHDREARVIYGYYMEEIDESVKRLVKQSCIRLRKTLKLNGAVGDTSTAASSAIGSTGAAGMTGAGYS